MPFFFIQHPMLDTGTAGFSTRWVFGDITLYGLYLK
jgi:hypothetical protein